MERFPDIEKQLNFIIEIDKLKTITRRSKIIHDDRYENDAEHSWHLAMMALVLHKQANADIDLFKVVKMLLIHDLVEIYAGDTFAYDAKGREDQFDRELKAAEKLFGMLPPELHDEFMGLWLEFEKKESNEAQFALALDRLQPIMLNHQNRGYTWKLYNVTKEQVLNRNREIEKGSESLWKYARHIVEKSAEQGFLSE